MKLHGSFSIFDREKGICDRIMDINPVGNFSIEDFAVILMRLWKDAHRALKPLECRKNQLTGLDESLDISELEKIEIEEKSCMNGHYDGREIKIGWIKSNPRHPPTGPSHMHFFHKNGRVSFRVSIAAAKASWHRQKVAQKYASCRLYRVKRCIYIYAPILHLPSMLSVPAAGPARSDSSLLHARQ